MYEKIAFVKTGWSDTYQGGAVFGRHDFISKYKEAHERFNFLPGPGGKYYAYVPPIGKLYVPPKPADKRDWLIVFVAAVNGKGPLMAVGWYNHATFENEYKPRPEYEMGKGFETDIEDEKYVYCVVAKNATLIPAAQRTHQVPGARFRRTPVIYVRGNKASDKWRADLAKLAERIVKMQNLGNQAKGQPSLRYPDEKHRRKVEKASVEEVKAHLIRMGYNIDDRQKECCGYDLLATRNRDRDELHVEVKGTSTSVMQFFMTVNERGYMKNPKWRLALVINALDRPKIRFFNSNKTNKIFSFSPYAWHASLK